MKSLVRLRSLFRSLITNGTAALALLGFQTMLPAEATAQDREQIAALINNLKSTDSDAQIEAAAELGLLGPYAASAVGPLSQQLKSADPGVRFECLGALGEIGPMAHPALQPIEGFLSDPEKTFQIAAIESIRMIGDASADARRKISGLCKSEDASIAVPAFRCLLNLQGESDPVVAGAVPSIIKALSDTRDEVQNEAALSLVELGPSVIPGLTEELKNADVSVRIAACQILGRNGSASASAVPAITRLLAGSEPEVRAAANALGAIHSEPQTTVPALTALVDRASLAVQLEAIQALGDFGPKASPALPTLRHLLKHSDPQIRSAAAVAIGHIGATDSLTIQQLLDLVSDNDGSVVVNAANALSLIGRPAVEPITARLEASNRAMLLVEVLGEIGPDAGSAVPQLLKLLKETRDLELQREIFVAMAMMGPAAAAAREPLTSLLNDSAAGDQRAGAAYVLAYLGDADIVPTLQQILKSKASDRVHRASAWALVRLTPGNAESAKIAVPHLMNAAQSTTPLARKEAVASLANLGPLARESAEVLKDLARNDTVPSIRAESIRGLADMQLPADDILPIAITGLKDPDASVRNASRYLLGRLGPAARSATSELRQSLRIGSRIDRIVTAWALIRIAPSEETTQQSLPLMLEALQSPNPKVRFEAANSLGLLKVNSSEVQKALTHAQSDEDPAVAQAASAALKAITSPM